MAYSGRWTPTHPEKYRGDPAAIRYRSLWERQCFKFLDTASFVSSWSSETVIIPYICATDGKPHRYFIDLKITFTDGRTFLVEIKPKKETRPPRSGRKTQKYLVECMTFAKNSSKWHAAKKYAEERGMTFEIWTEDHLTKVLGIKLF